MQDPRVVLLTGDHGYALFDEFRRLCPNQFINAGIAEQNMIGMAAGLARTGFKPIVYGLAAFVPVRVLEQIKLDLAHDKLPVLLLGDGAGFVYSYLGTSHQSTEDIACMRAIPNVTLFSPADASELELCFNLAHEGTGTTYLRLGKADNPRVHQHEITGYQLGDFLLAHDVPRAPVVMIATGSMVSVAVRLAGKLGTTSVWSAPTIKPLNADQLVTIASGANVIITLEEHSTLGGLGSAVCEILSERAPARVLRIGVDDRFSKLCGSYEYLRREHRLDDANIEARVLASIAGD